MKKNSFLELGKGIYSFGGGSHLFLQKDKSSLSRDYQPKWTQTNLLSFTEGQESLKDSLAT